MSHRFPVLAAALAALAGCATTTPAPPAPTAITAQDLHRHIAVLADDRFEGRAPGTQGERLTLDYIVAQLGARGVQPAGPDGRWLQPVSLVERQPGRSTAQWSVQGRPVSTAGEALVLVGAQETTRIVDAPVVFAGHGAVMPDRGIDQIGGDIRGAIALILLDGPAMEGFPPLGDRIAALHRAGAAGVIAISAPDAPWAALSQRLGQPVVRLAEDAWPGVRGTMRRDAAEALIRAAGADPARLLDALPNTFRPVQLPLRTTIEAQTSVRRIATHHVVGRIPGTGGGTQSVLLLGHWDHLGRCRPEGPDPICNGAVDNASGIATLIEAAERLAGGPRPTRDILILATTAEEMGLLGAEAFARNPVVPRETIRIAINVDTAAIQPAGHPVAVIGRGNSTLDPIIAQVVAASGRILDTDGEADIMVQRQDGWALTRNGIPTIMVNGAISDMALLRSFLSGPYHQPDDDLSRPIPLDGAAEDANLLVALARAFATPHILP